MRTAAAKHLEASGRVNISGIAATTGIPRADISRILKVPAETVGRPNDSPQQSTNRILAAWHEDPKFTGPNGQPADLSIYGRGNTFEALVKRYGRGIPTRALLDELVRTGAIELVASQKIRAKASVSVERGMSAHMIKAFGDRTAELLSTLLANMRQPESPRFVASASDASVASSALPLLRKELSTKGADFLAEIQEALTQRPSTHSAKRRRAGAARISVTIFYHETLDMKKSKPGTAHKRRNFRREA